MIRTQSAILNWKLIIALDLAVTVCLSLLQIIGFGTAPRIFPNGLDKVKFDQKVFDTTLRYCHEFLIEIGIASIVVLCINYILFKRYSNTPLRLSLIVTIAFLTLNLLSLAYFGASFMDKHHD